MFRILQAPYRSADADLLDQMYRLRKRVFIDQLGWSLQHCSAGLERDRYDGMDPVYIVWTDERTGTLLGSTRLMPTTGPTLLYDVFSKTFPDAACLAAPGIWEATRTCVDCEAIAALRPDIAASDAFATMCLAIIECGRAHGIHTIVSNYEPHMKRVYRRAGLQLDEVGRADGYGRLPVCCGIFDISPPVEAAVRAKLGLPAPLFAPIAPERVAA
jgi:acyl homoserine lactone synthase